MSASVVRGFAAAGSRALARQGRVAVAALGSVPVSSSTLPRRTCRCHGAASCCPGGGFETPFLGVRHFSDASATAGKESAAQGEEAPPPKTEEEEAAASTEEGAEDAAAEDAGGAPPTPSREDELEAQLKDLKDQLLRSLAEQENTRNIAKRDVTAAKSFAVASMAKSLLDTSDNLSRAMESVPEEYRKDTENHPVLATLYEGIHMTDAGLTKAFAKNGLTKFGESGEKFDPNRHEALYEYPDPEKEAGMIGQVMKPGFVLNGRVVRPAEVGVVKKV